MNAHLPIVRKLRADQISDCIINLAVATGIGSSFVSMDFTARHRLTD
jgi:hypothetical protein